MTAPEWRTVRLWVSVAAAVVAAIAAVGQIRASRGITDEESKASVAADIEESAASLVLIDLLFQQQRVSGRRPDLRAGGVLVVEVRRPDHAGVVAATAEAHRSDGLEDP